MLFSNTDNFKTAIFLDTEHEWLLVIKPNNTSNYTINQSIIPRKAARKSATLKAFKFSTK